MSAEDLSLRVTQLEQKLEEVLLLLSDVYKYGKLRELLAASKWKEADIETTKLMLSLSGRNDRDFLTPEDVQGFPCDAIQVIDQLWKKYSGDRFGFSIQLEIYQKNGGSLDSLRVGDIKILRAFADEIEWRKDGSIIDFDLLNFSQEAPRGHLPAHWWRSPYGVKMANFFLTRLINCQIN